MPSGWPLPVERHGQSATASPIRARYGRSVSNQAAAKSPASLTRRYLPGIWVLRGYQRTWLRGDLLAGVTVAAYLVPQVMAYAEVAGLPAIAGLWAAVAPLVAYAVFGSSRQLSVGPSPVPH